jgi:hypothetical protein
VDKHSTRIGISLRALWTISQLQVGAAEKRENGKEKANVKESASERWKNQSDVSIHRREEFVSPK